MAASSYLIVPPPTFSSANFATAAIATTVATATAASAIAMVTSSPPRYSQYFCDGWDDDASTMAVTMMPPHLLGWWRLRDG